MDKNIFELIKSKKAVHYSHFISKENYREHMMGVFNDWNNNKHKS